jgi:hypothetical protein
MSEDIYNLHLINGGNLAYWLKNAAFVNEFITTFNKAAQTRPNATQITALSIEQQQTYTMGLATPVMQPAAASVANTVVKTKILKEEAPLSKTQSIWWHGGMKSPHFHHDGKIYPLTQEQWGTFVDSAMKQMGKSLASAKNVSFGSFQNVARAVEEIT